jgi:hypothetical protein
MYLLIKRGFHTENIAGEFLLYVKEGPFTKDWIHRVVAIHLLSFSDYPKGSNSICYVSPSTG